MFRFMIVAVGLAAGAAGAEPAGKPAPVVELRWVETKRIEGLTAAMGFQSSCDPDDIVYPHMKPALTLTPADVAKTDLKEIKIAGTQYMVEFHLTAAARKALAATAQGNAMRLLTVTVDGRHWGVARYEKDAAKPFVPDQSRAEAFVPSVGFMPSKPEAERLAGAFTK